MTQDQVSIRSQDIELVKADARRHTPSHSKNLEVFKAESMTLHGIRKTIFLTVCWNDEHFSYEKGIHGVVVNLEDPERVEKLEPDRIKSPSGAKAR